MHDCAVRLLVAETVAFTRKAQVVRFDPTRHQAALEGHGLDARVRQGVFGPSDEQCVGSDGRQLADGRSLKKENNDI